MNRYFFILGRNQALSLAEIIQYFRKIGRSLAPVYFSQNFFIFDTDEKIDLCDINSRLGGVIKSGKILKEKEISGREEMLIEDIKRAVDKNFVADELLNPKGKKSYLGFSLYLAAGGNFFSLKKDIEKYFLFLKKELKNEGKSIRFVTSREDTLSSVVVKNNKLLTAGSETNIFVSNEKIYIGRTSSVQDFEGYNQRDYGRPARDMEIGLMPPKLARILINLSGAGKDDAILDPFCGCGTILQEALVMGFRNIIGSDINLAAVENAKNNINWLRRIYRLEEDEKILKIIPFDARQLEKDLAPRSVDCVVTEPYLGPPIRLKISEAKLRSIAENVIHLYLDFFRSIKNVLKTGGKIVIVWPVFRLDHTLYPLPILDEIINMGFEKEELIPSNFSEFASSQMTKRESILYSRPDQNVLREIFIFKNVQKN